MQLVHFIILSTHHLWNTNKWFVEMLFFLYINYRYTKKRLVRNLLQRDAEIPGY